MGIMTIDVHHFPYQEDDGRDVYKHLESGEFDDVIAYRHFDFLTSGRSGPLGYTIILIEPNMIAVAHHYYHRIEGTNQIAPRRDSTIVNMYIYTFTYSDEGPGQCCTRNIFRMMHQRASIGMQQYPEYEMSAEIREELYGTKN